MNFRQIRVIDAAQSVIRQHGLRSAEPIILHDRNHTIVHLAPYPIVAKAAVDKVIKPRTSSLSREVAVAAALANAGASVVRPSITIPPGPHNVSGVELSLWDYCAAGAAVSNDHNDELSRSLKLLHQCMSRIHHQFPPLPLLNLQFEETDELLSVGALTHLPAADRAFLRDRLRQALAHIDWNTVTYQPLHGECNPQQAIATASGPYWLDFESACLGPIEWDLANMDDATLAAYGPFNVPLLSLIRTVRLVCTIAWCWRQPDRAPEVREAAEYHLAELKNSSL